MFRKITLALAAAAFVGAAALGPTAALAKGGGGGGGGGKGGWGGPKGGWGGHHFIIGAPGFYGACVVQQWVDTPFGPRLRYVNVC